MAREKEAYRPILEDILGFTNGKRLLNVAEVSKYTGKSKPWCSKHVPFKDGVIHAADLARFFA